jgi:crotonobetainyl-CoA:carnitine CoA-transferase CaiB-like acyl-CoA transferase
VEVLATLFSTAITTYTYRGVTGIRNGNRGGFLYPDVFLPCKDGHVGLVCNQLQQWIRFLELMGMPEWTQDPRYRDRRKMTEDYPDEVDALMGPWMTERTRDELFAMCREKHIPLAPAYDVQELLDNAHLAERQAFQTVETGVGPLRFPAPPYKMSETQPWLHTRAPRLGEHNVEIFCERLGRDREELGRLASAGVI